MSDTRTVRSTNFVKVTGESAPPKADGGPFGEQESDLFLLRPKDRALLKSVDGFFQHLPLGHSHYQIKNFIIGQFERCSPDRAHKQCLLEIHTRYNALLDMHYRYSKTELEIEEERINQEEAQYKLENVAKDEFERRRLEVAAQKAELEIAMREFGLVNIKKSIGETMREVWHFKEEMDRLAPLRKFPGSYEQSEPEYWQKEYLNRFLQGRRGENLPPIPEADEDKLIEVLKEKIRLLESKTCGKPFGSKASTVSSAEPLRAELRSESIERDTNLSGQ